MREALKNALDGGVRRARAELGDLLNWDHAG